MKQVKGADPTPADSQSKTRWKTDRGIYGVRLYPLYARARIEERTVSMARLGRKERGLLSRTNTAGGKLWYVRLA